MTKSLHAAWAVAQYLLQRAALLVIAAMALGLGAYTVASAAGEAPWLTLPLQFGDHVIPNAGIVVQIAVTVLALAMCFYLPSHARMMALETSHRNFHMGMRDVARAYAAAHAADRTGVFTLSSEFDSIRERIAHLRAHPDLGDLEPEVIELAAQMAHVSRELARTYSDRNVARARDFLIQRQEDIAEFEDRVRLAKQVADELTRWCERVERDERVARSQLDQLRAELADILPELRPAAPEPARAEAPATPGDNPVVALLARRRTAQ